ncbi:ABC transporter substrate-binding protein [Pseudonocardia sp. CA-107938]|uniref:ABC transporter substrate-binding protein n=1 Tax=Pseudonocardia sp. CA-107938 TaxID=3240021 RepID=UPI003D8EFD8B
MTHVTTRCDGRRRTSATGARDSRSFGTGSEQHLLRFVVHSTSERTPMSFPQRRDRNRSAAVLAGLLSAVLTLSACGGIGNSQSSGGSSGPVAYDDDATVTFAGPLVGLDLDPYKAGGLIGGIIDIYDPLITPQFDLSLKPGLATDWSWSPDNLKLTLNLRQDVTFSDGTPFDSSAVVASLNRARSGETSTQKNALAPITDVSASGPHSAVVTVKQPFPALPSLLASPAGFQINPKLINNQQAILSGAKGIGTGPYEVTSFKPTTNFELTKRKDYWDAASIQHAPTKFTFLYTNDGNARLNGLKSGQYQGVQSTGTPGLTGPGALQQTNKDFENTLAPSLYIFGVSFAFDRAPFNNMKVRQAIQHAVDWNSITPKVLSDAMLCEPNPPAQLPTAEQLGFNKDAKAPAFDVGLAKQLLAEAGFPDGKGLPPVTVTSSTASQDIVAAQAMQPALAAIGITLNINSQPSRTFQVAQVTGGNAQMITVNLTNGGGIDMSLGYNIGVLSPPGWVDSASPEGKQYASLIQQAGQNPANEQRTQLYQQAEQVAQQNAFYIPFCRTQVGYAHTAKVDVNRTFWSHYGAVKASSLTVAKAV